MRREDYNKISLGFSGGSNKTCSWYEEVGCSNQIFKIFGRNNFDPNGGVVLVNIRKFREDNIFRNAYFSSMAYNFFPCPFQEIMLIISNYKFKFLPLIFNLF